MTLVIEDLYFDEDVPRQLVSFLQQRGVHIHLPHEVNTLSVDDPVHLQTSTSQGWVFVTQNRRDFRRLHWLWMTFYHWNILTQPHGGILSIYEQIAEVPERWAHAVYELTQRMDSLQGQMFMWRPSDGRWEPQPVRFM